MVNQKDKLTIKEERAKALKEIFKDHPNELNNHVNHFFIKSH